MKFLTSFLSEDGEIENIYERNDLMSIANFLNATDDDVSW